MRQQDVPEFIADARTTCLSCSAEGQKTSRRD
jgi:hypothetical protein